MHEHKKELKKKKKKWKENEANFGPVNFVIDKITYDGMEWNGAKQNGIERRRRHFSKLLKKIIIFVITKYYVDGRVVADGR